MTGLITRQAFRKDLASMQEKLVLPEAVRGTQAAKDAGLGGESVQLLPSFLHLLRAAAALLNLFVLSGLNGLSAELVGAFCVALRMLRRAQAKGQKLYLDISHLRQRPASTAPGQVVIKPSFLKDLTTIFDRLVYTIAALVMPYG